LYNWTNDEALNELLSNLAIVESMMLMWYFHFAEHLLIGANLRQWTIHIPLKHVLIIYDNKISIQVQDPTNDKNILDLAFIFQ